MKPRFRFFSIIFSVLLLSPAACNSVPSFPDKEAPKISPVPEAALKPAPASAEEAKTQAVPEDTPDVIARPEPEAPNIAFVPAEPEFVVPLANAPAASASEKNDTEAVLAKTEAPPETKAAPSGPASAREAAGPDAASGSGTAEKAPPPVPPSIIRPALPLPPKQPVPARVTEPKKPAEAGPKTALENPAPPAAAKPPAAAPQANLPAAPPPPAAPEKPAPNPNAGRPGLPERSPPAEFPVRAAGPSSRVVRAVAGQFVEVPFRGSGWVYIGEQNSARGAAYDSRRLDDEGQTFVFRAEKPGDYFLTFGKQDFVNDSYINDVVELIVGEPDSSARPGQISNSRVSADPRWPFPGTQISGARPVQAASQAQAQTPDAGVPESRGQSGLREPFTEDDGAGKLPSEVSESSGQNYLASARDKFKAGNFPECISALDKLRMSEDGLNAEALWLYGQSFEANSPARDIKSAVDSYRRIIRDFPQSDYYEQARGRNAYLNRFYFNMR